MRRGRDRGVVLGAGLMLALLAPAAARAYPPITSSPPPRAVDTAADSSVEAIARSAERLALRTTNTGVGAGVVLMVAAIPAVSGGLFVAGEAVAAAGAIIGPAQGWDRAGYPGRGAGGILLRAGIVTLGAAWPLLGSQGDGGELTGLAILLGGLGGVSVAAVQAWFECGTIAPYVREHGPGRARVALAPAWSPARGPGLAVVVGLP